MNGTGDEAGIRCPKCGEAVSPGNRFCTHCGAPISEHKEGSQAYRPVYPQDTPEEKRVKHDVMISYSYHSERDKKTADAVCSILEAKKIRCWIAPRDVVPGMRWGEEIVEAIDECRIMVLIFSKNSNESMNVMREVERAVSKGRPIIPFRIDDILPSRHIEYFLAATHWLDALTPPLEKHLHKLLLTVQQLMGVMETKVEETEYPEPAYRPDAFAPEPKRDLSKYKKPVIYASIALLVIIAVMLTLTFTVFVNGYDRAKAAEYVKEAEALIEDGEYEKALEKCELAVKEDPTFAAAYFNRGDCLFFTDEYERAIEDYDKAIELDPNHAEAYWSRALALSALERYDEALADCDKAIELEPDSAMGYLARALVFSELGMFDEADADLEMAMSLEGSGEEEDEESSDLEDEIADYTKAIELNPDDDMAYYNRGDCYYFLDEYEKAIEDYTRAIELDPDHAEAYWSRGLALSSLEEHEKAIDDYTKAIEIDPYFDQPYLARAISLTLLGRFEEAVFDCNKCLELDQDSADAYLIRGSAYYLAGSEEQAVKDLRKALELDPSLVEAQELLDEIGV